MIRVAGIVDWLGRSLTRKLALLLFGFLTLQAVQLGIGFFGVLHLGEEGAFINEAGRQRYRTLLLHTLAEQVLAGQSEPSLLAETVAAANDHFDRFERFLDRDRWIEGLFIHQASHDHVRSAVKQARDAWERELRPQVTSGDPARPMPTRAGLARYRAGMVAQVERLEEVVTALEQSVRDNTRGLALFHAIVLVASLVLGGVGFVVARLLVARPLRELNAAASAIAGGAYDRRLTASSHDELGELAGTFNRMANAVEHRTRRIQTLNRAAAAITSTLNKPEIVAQLLQHGVELSGLQAASIAFYDEGQGRFTESHATGLSERFRGNMVFRPGGLADEVFSRGEPVLCSDHPQAAHKLSALARDEGVRSYLCLPLVSHASRLGVLCFYRRDADTFTTEESGLLSAFARLAAQAFENARLHARAEEMALTDPLTGLHNRRWLDERLQEEVQRSQRFGKAVSVLLLDVDHFKHINDQYGHPAGDVVLRRLVEVVQSELREVDMAARYGGEEFVVVFPETGGLSAKQGAERIRRAVAATSFEMPGGRRTGATVSIGVACYPDCAVDGVQLIARADQALYVAKHGGRNRVVLYREMLTAEIEKDPNRIVALLREDTRNIPSIVTAVAAKGTFYRGHTELVERVAAWLAEALGLPAAERDSLRFASQLHDIGMAVIPDSLLNKSTPLTPDEWQRIREHPAVAAQLLEQVPALRHLAPIVRHHHERWDGDGYPDGLKGEAIPYLARVLAVADAYASLVSDWLGRQAGSAEAAIAELRAGAGTQLDPELVRVLIETLAQEAADNKQRSA